MFSASPGKRNADRIDGFRAADDSILLERTLFTGIAKADGTALKGGQFHASKSGKAHDKSDRILYDTTDGKLYWDATAAAPAMTVNCSRRSRAIRGSTRRIS